MEGINRCGQSAAPSGNQKSKICEAGGSTLKTVFARPDDIPLGLRHVQFT